MLKTKHNQRTSGSEHDVTHPQYCTSTCRADHSNVELCTDSSCPFLSCRGRWWRRGYLRRFTVASLCHWRMPSRQRRNFVWSWPSWMEETSSNFTLWKTFRAQTWTDSHRGTVEAHVSHPFAAMCLVLFTAYVIWQTAFFPTFLISQSPTGVQLSPKWLYILPRCATVYPWMMVLNHSLYSGMDCRPISVTRVGNFTVKNLISKCGGDRLSVTFRRRCPFWVSYWI